MSLNCKECDHTTDCADCLIESATEELKQQLAKEQENIRQYCQTKCPVKYNWANKEHDCDQHDCPLY
jgi:glutathione peroxidase-family protein